MQPLEIFWWDSPIGSHPSRTSTWGSFYYQPKHMPKVKATNPSKIDHRFAIVLHHLIFFLDPPAKKKHDKFMTPFTSPKKWVPNFMDPSVTSMTSDRRPKSPADLKASATSSKASKAPWWITHGPPGWSHLSGWKSWGFWLPWSWEAWKWAKIRELCILIVWRVNIFWYVVFVQINRAYRFIYAHRFIYCIHQNRTSQNLYRIPPKNKWN